MSDPRLYQFLAPSYPLWTNVLCCEGLVVHEEEFDIAGVVDEESLVAGGHHMSGLLVGSETDRRHNHLLKLEQPSHDVISTNLSLEPTANTCFFTS